MSSWFAGANGKKKASSANPVTGGNSNRPVVTPAETKVDSSGLLPQLDDLDPTLDAIEALIKPAEAAVVAAAAEAKPKKGIYQKPL